MFILNEKLIQRIKKFIGDFSFGRELATDNGIILTKGAGCPSGCINGCTGGCTGCRDGCGDGSTGVFKPWP